MTTHLFQCPSCGAPLTPKGSNTTVNCPYCNLSVVVPEDLRRVSDAAAWSTLVFDGFTSNQNKWSVEDRTPDQYFSMLNRTIVNGRYRWQARMAISSSSIAPDWLNGYYVLDFHLIVNCKHIRGSWSGSSWGVVFRVQDNHNYYYFHITDHQFFAVSVMKDGKWQNLTEWTRSSTIKPNGVNQLEVIADQAHFIFLINGKIVNEVDDDQFSEGMVGLAVEAYTPDEETAFVALQLQPAPVDHELRTLGDARIDIAADLVKVNTRDQRAHFVLVVGARPDLQTAHFRRQRLHEFVGDGSYRDRHRQSGSQHNFFPREHRRDAARSACA